MDQFNITQSPVVLPDHIVSPEHVHEAVVANVLAERPLWDDVMDAGQAEAWFMDAAHHALRTLDVDGAKKVPTLDGEQWESFLRALQLGLGSQWRMERVPAEGEREIAASYRQAWTCGGRFDADAPAATHVQPYVPPPVD